jgi:hypothetical protein
MFLKEGLADTAHLGTVQKEAKVTPHQSSSSPAATPLPEFIIGRKIIWGTTLHPEDNRWVITTDSLSADELRVFSQGFDSRADAAIRLATSR